MNESKKKNILIGGLLAVVLVMAVGYAAFATQLNINGSATIDTSWNIHFDTDKIAGTSSTQTDTDVSGVLAITKAGSADPTGALWYEGDLTAHIAATLKQPGDSEVFTLTIVNDGTFDATKDSVALALDSTTSSQQGAPTVNASDRTVTVGNIKFDITEPANSLPSGSTGNTTTMTVTATYVAPNVQTAGAGEGTPITGNVTSQSQTAGITVTVVYKQASA